MLTWAIAPLETASRAHDAARFGLPWSSHTVRASGRPLTPPFLLIVSTAACAASAISGFTEAAFVSGLIVTILIGSPVAALEPDALEDDAAVAPDPDEHPASARAATEQAV